MCNAYRIGPDAGQQGLALAESVLAMVPAGGMLVRKTDAAPVVTGDGVARMMRWGFHRSFNAAINNTRADKLESRLWAGAFHDRRCLIPVTAFYEWSATDGRRKQAYEFRNPQGGYLWIAGIWEEHPDLGPCFSMITTDAPKAVAAIHHRMPAVLADDARPAYLTDPAPPGPYGGALAVNACASPLVKAPAAGVVQEEWDF